LTTALDAAHGRGTVRRYSWPGRARRVGVENLRCESAFDRNNPHDEDHAWTGGTGENAEDVWVRQVTFAHFAGSGGAVWWTPPRDRRPGRRLGRGQLRAVAVHRPGGHLPQAADGAELGRRRLGAVRRRRPLAAAERVRQAGQPVRGPTRRPARGPRRGPEAPA